MCARNQRLGAVCGIRLRTFIKDHVVLKSSSHIFPEMDELMEAPDITLQPANGPPCRSLPR